MADPLFTDRALQDAHRALMMKGPAGAHLDEGMWDRLAGDELSASERDHLFDHIVSCEACATIWRGLSALRDEAQSQGLIPADAPAASRSFRSPLVALAVAASVILVSGLVVFRQSQPVSVTPAVEPQRPVTPAAPPSFLQAFTLAKADVHIAPEEALAPRGI